MHELVGVFVPGDDRNRFVLAVIVQVADILVFVTGGRGRELGTVEQRFVAVLVAVEQRIEGERIAWVVAVHRGIGRRADRNRCVGRVADEDHQRREQHEIEHRAPFFMGEIYADAERSQQGHYEEHEARIDGQPQRVDEEEVEQGADIDRMGNDDAVDENKNRARNEGADRDTLEGDALCFAEIVDEYQRGNGQQVEDVHADRKPHQVGDQHDPARGVGFVGLLLPFEHQPYDQRREHRREGVDLALVGREPEGVGEGIGECSHRTCAQYGHDVGFRKLRALTGEDAACQVGDRPEKEQDAERAGQAVHGVHHVGYIVRRGCQYRGQAGQQHEERCSGRVPYFEFIRGSDEFGAVPQARRGLHGQQIGHGRDGEDDPADDVVPAFEVCHIFSVCFALCPAKVII